MKGRNISSVFRLYRGSVPVQCHLVPLLRVFLFSVFAYFFISDSVFRYSHVHSKAVETRVSGKRNPVQRSERDFSTTNRTIGETSNVYVKRGIEVKHNNISSPVTVN